MLYYDPIPYSPLLAIFELHSFISYEDISVRIHAVGIWVMIFNSHLDKRSVTWGTRTPGGTLKELTGYNFVAERPPVKLIANL